MIATKSIINSYSRSLLEETSHWFQFLCGKTTLVRVHLTIKFLMKGFDSIPLSIHWNSLSFLLLSDKLLTFVVDSVLCSMFHILSAILTTKAEEETRFNSIYETWVEEMATIEFSRSSWGLSPLQTPPKAINFNSRLRLS